MKNEAHKMFDMGLKTEDAFLQNDILKRASEEWLELNKRVAQLKDEE